MPRAAKPNEREHRRTQVAELWLAGIHVPEIAEKLGVSRQTVWKDTKAIEEEWLRVRFAAVEERRARSLQVFAEAQRANWEAAHHGAPNEQIAAWRIILEAERDTIKLLGLNEPVRTEITVLTVDLVEAEISRIKDQLADERSKRSAALDVGGTEAAQRRAG